MKKVRRRMRCPLCKSLKTVKNGKRGRIYCSFHRKSTREIQRYRCKECKRSFTVGGGTKRRYSNEFKMEITRMHVEERMSYRVISKRIRERYGIKISKSTVCQMVNEIALRSKGDIAIKREYNPRWSGYLTIDDKYIRLNGVKKIMLIATDTTGDIVHAELLELEEQQCFDSFIRFIKERLRYPFKGVTTDLDEMLEKSIVRELGERIPHQKCLKHAMDNIAKLIELVQKRRRLDNVKGCGKCSREEYQVAELEYKEAEAIYRMSKKLLYGTKEEFTEVYDNLRRYFKSYPKLQEFFTRHLDKLLTHQETPKICKTNNIAENVNRQLMRRLKTIESFQRFSTAEAYLNLYKNHLRFKPYTDCRGKNKRKNGKSPLEVCGVTLKTKDWLKNSIYFY